MDPYEHDTILSVIRGLEDEAHLATALRPYIERLRGLVACNPNEARTAPDFDAIDRRIAEVESRVRLNTHRIEAVRTAMRECVASKNMHESVRFLADTLAINLDSAPPEGK